MSHGGLGKFPNKVLATCPGPSPGRLDAGGGATPEIALLSGLLTGRTGGNLAGGAYIGHRKAHSDTSDTVRITPLKAMSRQRGTYIALKLWARTGICSLRLPQSIKTACSRSQHG